MQWINYRVKVTITDGRQMVGNLLAFDKHMNIVLSDTEEFRRIKAKRDGEPEREQKRTLGMILMRGENVISITAEAPPPPQMRRPGEGLVIGRAKQEEKGIIGSAPKQAPAGLAPPPSLGGPPPELPMKRPPPPGFEPPKSN